MNGPFKCEKCGCTTYVLVWVAGRMQCKVSCRG